MTTEQQLKYHKGEVMDPKGVDQLSEKGIESVAGGIDRIGLSPGVYGSAGTYDSSGQVAREE